MAERTGLQKRKQGKFYRYSLVRLAPNDIKEIIQLFIGIGTTHELSVGNYTLNGADDVDALVEEPEESTVSNAQFDCFSPHASLELRHHSASMYVSDVEDLTLLGLERRISTILLRRRGVLGSFRWPGLLVGGVTVGLAASASIVVRELTDIEPRFVYWPILAPGMTYMFIFLWLDGSRHTLIRLATPRGIQGFVARNSDQLAIAVLAVFLATAGTLFVAIVT